jgi:hypothetical protein
LSADELADPDTLSAAHLTFLSPHLLGVPSTSDGSSPTLHRHAHLARSPGAHVSPSGAGASHSPRGLIMQRRPLSAPGSPRLGLVRVELLAFNGDSARYPKSLFHLPLTYLLIFLHRRAPSLAPHEAIGQCGRSQQLR